MAERDNRFALGMAAGAAVAAVGAAGAAVIRARAGGGDGDTTAGPETGTKLDPQFSHEEPSGRGEPAGGPDLKSRESGYEVKDARVSALVKVMLVSISIMVGSTAAVFFMYSRFDHAFQEPNADLTAEQKAPIPPPLPHLQAEPYRDIDAVLMEQTQRLTTYGWNSSDHKGAHIPIQRAIQQVIGKPLDGPAQADAAGPKGSNAPQPATPAYSADQPQEKPANSVEGEGNPSTVAPSMTEPLTSGAKP